MVRICIRQRIVAVGKLRRVTWVFECYRQFTPAGGNFHAIHEITRTKEGNRLSYIDIHTIIRNSIKRSYES